MVQTRFFGKGFFKSNLSNRKLLISEGNINFLVKPVNHLFREVTFVARSLQLVLRKLRPTAIKGKKANAARICVAQICVDMANQGE
jgi:hypothetical protein